MRYAILILCYAVIGAGAFGWAPAWSLFVALGAAIVNALYWRKFA